MRSNCRSLLISLCLLSSLSLLETCAAPRFSFLLIAPTLAKGASDSATTGDSDAEGGPAPKCSPSAAGTPGATRGQRFSHSFAGERGLGHKPLDFSMLNLTEEQKSKIKTIQARNAAHAKELRQSLGAKGREFRDLIYSETSTGDQIMAKRDEMKPLKDELENLRLSDFLACRGVLTSEQRKKWAETKPPSRKSHQHGGGLGDSDSDKTGSIASPKVK